jgi:hypothetical protein
MWGEDVKSDNYQPQKVELPQRQPEYQEEDT